MHTVSLFRDSAATHETTGLVRAPTVIDLGAALAIAFDPSHRTAVGT
jgi:hypothetical protein